MDFDTFDKVNNIYPFHQNQHRQTERVARTYDNVSSKLFGIPNFRIEIETNEGKMAGIYGKTNKQIMVDNWRGDNEVKGAIDSMLADPRFDEIINGHTTKPPRPPPPPSSSSSSSSESSTPPPDLSPITPPPSSPITQPPTPALRVGTVSNLLKSDDKKNNKINISR